MVIVVQKRCLSICVNVRTAEWKKRIKGSAGECKHVLALFVSCTRSAASHNNLVFIAMHRHWRR